MSLFRYISSLSTTFIHLQNIFKIYKSSPVTRTESMEFTCIQAASWWSTPTAPFSVGHWWAKRTITVFGGELNPMESYYESNIWDLENWSCIRFPPKNLPRIWCLNSKACRGLHKNTVCKWKLLKTIYILHINTWIGSVSHHGCPSQVPHRVKHMLQVLAALSPSSQINLCWRYTIHILTVFMCIL